MANHKHSVGEALSFDTAAGVPSLLYSKSQRGVWYGLIIMIDELIDSLMNWQSDWLIDLEDRRSYIYVKLYLCTIIWLHRPCYQSSGPCLPEAEVLAVPWPQVKPIEKGSMGITTPQRWRFLLRCHDKPPGHPWESPAPSIQAPGGFKFLFLYEELEVLDPESCSSQLLVRLVNLLWLVLGWPAGSIKRCIDCIVHVEICRAHG